MRRLLLLATTGLAFILAGTACGDGTGPDRIATVSGDTSGDEGSGATELTDHERGVAFAECMRENGVDVADPDPDGRGGIMLRRGEFDPELVQAALEACRDLMPEGRRPADLDPETREQLREFAECMRGHGVDVPDPDPNGAPMQLNGDLDPESPEFEAAMQACQDLLAGLRGGGR